MALALVVAPPIVRPKTGRGLDFSPFVAGWRGRMLPYIVIAVPLAAVLVATGALAAEAGIRWLLVGGLVLLVGAKPWFLAGATAVVLALATFVLQPAVDFRARSFFGVTEVMSSPDGELTLLMNGTTVHGSQSTDPAVAGRRRATTSRPGRSATCSVRSDNGRTRTSRSASPASAVGRLAAYADERTAMTFFEIDPIVIKVASDPRTSRISPTPRPARGHRGRRATDLRDQPDDRFDLLIMDAFSSDTVADPPADRRGVRRGGADPRTGRAHLRVTSPTATTTSPRPSPPASGPRA